MTFGANFHLWKLFNFGQVLQVKFSYTHGRRNDKDCNP
jgi:hypothetical protein